jgi:two-component system NtrC family sensor kinase
MVVILNRMVLQPLARVTQHAVAIGKGTDLVGAPASARPRRSRETRARVRRMVEHVADSRRDLVDQSFQAGFAELAKGVLHNLGNAMTPLRVRLAKLEDRLARRARL